MKKHLVIFATLTFLSSCSTLNKSSVVSSQSIYFAESSGKIKMEIDKSGKWTSIESAGSAALLADDSHAIEQAFNMATMRAKGNLAEFLNNEIKSDKSTETIISLTKELETKDNLSTKVVENITSNSKIILKGVYVTERKISEDRKYVFVQIKTDKKTVDAINSLIK